MNIPIKELLKPTTGAWTLKDLKTIPKNNFNVFSCFHCGGGSSMGYKLAGFNVLGGVEIDPKIMDIYKINHCPEYSYLMPVKDFNKISNTKLPSSLTDNLDILDGSPPCSVFSMAGSREKKWGSEHAFREGQAIQRLDDLFFDFINTANKLQPKVVLAENVKGLIIGNAKGYVKEIFAAFYDAGYECQLFLLNSAKMSVPQKRERTFFIARRRDLNLYPLKLSFNEPSVSVRQAFRGTSPLGAKQLSPKAYKLWSNTKPGNSFSKAAKGSWFTWKRLSFNSPAPTLVSGSPPSHPLQPRHLSPSEIIRIQSFPDDYNFKNLDPVYVCGMSVPPFMIQRIALQIIEQWFLSANL